MANNVNGTTSRKPSGSSTHSGPGHSPSGSPNSAAAHNRTLNPASANNVFGVAMGPQVGMKGINNGWQMWSNGTSPSSTPISKRTPSMSSSASLNDTPQHTPGGWVPKPTGAWDVGNPPNKEWDLDGSPKKKELIQLDSHSPNNGSFSFQHARQRQAAAAQAAAFSSPHKPHNDTRRIVSESEVRLNTLVGSNVDDASSGLGSAGPKMSPGSGHTSYVATSPFTPQHSTMPLPVHINGNYDGSPLNHNDDMSLGLRNMSMGESYDQSPQNHGFKNMPHANTNNYNGRGPPQPQPPLRSPYNGYPQQPDYSQYYAGAVAPEGYADYSYGYDQYRGNGPDASAYGPNANGRNMYPTITHPDILRPPTGVFYPEFNGVGVARPPGTQYYYHAPHQQMLFHAPTSPMPSPMVAAALPAGPMGDKKRELQNMQYNFQQHQQLTHQQNMLMASMRHASTSPLPQFSDYLGGMTPLLPPGTPLYAHAPRGLHPQHAYQQHHSMRQRRPDPSHDAGAGLRSPTLEEFRANKTRKWELRDIFGFVVEFSGDQHGSRFIQQKLETASSEEKQIVFDEILPDSVLPLITDVFGNYVIQKLFEHGTQLQKTVLANSMEGHVLTLSLQMYGCRVVQKAIEFVLPDQQGALVRELDGHVMKCVKDANGNHVIQKLIERVSPDRLAFVNSFRGSVYELSTHPYGCRVLQRCFEHLPDAQTRPLLDELHKYTPNLMQDQFGNYVIQFVLERGTMEDRSSIISKLKGQLLQMAKHKFASNVCEKALVMADAVDRHDLIDEILSPKQEGASAIIIMMKDQFANYVLQRALSVVDDDQRGPLIEKIRPLLVTMRRYSNSYSKHLLSIERLLQDKSPEVPEVKITSDSPTKMLVPPQVVQ